jgi:hypothetical protein
MNNSITPEGLITPLLRGQYDEVWGKILKEQGNETRTL